MAAPAKPKGDDVAMLPVGIHFPTGTACAEGVYLLAEFTCAALPEGAHMVVDTKTNHLMLAAPCGCVVKVDLTALLLRLIVSASQPHDGAASGTVH